ncbi:MAG: AAA family ATPase [Patescibacteria group bacterium]|nr:AAA family ATPase [Patescibacteria group bacterium]
MYLEKLELQGFKSFAQKTVMEFPVRAKSAKAGVAAIVGPNGSGKSNTADAVRWVLGEQSIKLLRGKQASDVIFSGSALRARLGFAEVALYLNNEDKKADIEYEKLVIKRRVYRDGSGEYQVNGARVRLADIQLLLAQASFGSRSYSVIGQGMTDAILSASAFERKSFFDEATGVKQFQIKRESAKGKIKTTEENLAQVKSMIREISPRLSMLAKQIEKREKRSRLSEELSQLQKIHYGTLWHGIGKKLAELSDRKKGVEKSHLSVTKKLTELQNKLAKLNQEQKSAKVGGYDQVQSGYHEALAKKNERAAELAGLSAELAVLKDIAKERPAFAHSEKLATRAAEAITLFEDIEKAHTLPSFKALLPAVKKLRQALLASLTPKNSTTSADSEKIAILAKHIASLTAKLAEAASAVADKQNLVDKLRHAESRATADVFLVQKQYQELQRELNRVVAEKNQIDIDIAKAETRKHDLAGELDREVPGSLRPEITNYQPKPHDRRAEWSAIATLRSELELIGGIEEHVDSEYTEAKKRHDFLSSQYKDLEQALEATKAALHELDATIEKQFTGAFRKIEEGFAEYFKLLFNGGSAKLELFKQSELDTLNEDVAAGLTKKEQDDLSRSVKTGIEIKANPPGKKVASISMLSGGERALTSIALICAIIRANPSPFVVLDEVDAALDEANSERFAQILRKLSQKTQCIAITHNRATMEQANILYGVTMGENGVSKLLSVDLEKAVDSIT